MGLIDGAIKMGMCYYFGKKRDRKKLEELKKKYMGEGMSEGIATERAQGDLLEHHLGKKGSWGF